MFILIVSKPFDRDQFLKQLGKTTAQGPKRRVLRGRGGVDRRPVPGRRTLAFGTVQAIQFMVDNAPPQKPGPLTPAIELAPREPAGRGRGEHDGPARRRRRASS